MTKDEYLKQMKAINAQLAKLRKAYRKTAFKRAAEDFADSARSLAQVARKHALTPRELEKYMNTSGHMQKRAALDAQTAAAIDNAAREFNRERSQPR